MQFLMTTAISSFQKFRLAIATTNATFNCSSVTIKASVAKEKLRSFSTRV